MRPYINEFTSRLNESNCQINSENRFELLFRGLVGETITDAKHTA